MSLDCCVKDVPGPYPLKKNRRAQVYFDQLAPSYRRAYIGWIDSAKRDDTKQRRLTEALERLEAGQKLGLK